MIRSRTAYLAIFLALTLSTANAANIAGGKLNLQTSASVNWTDKVVPSQNGTEDIYFTLEPTLVYAKDTSKTKVEASFSTPIKRYDGFEIFDSNDLVVAFNGSVPFIASGRFSGNWNVNYFDGTQEDLFRNGILDQQSLSARFRTNFRIGNRISLRTTLGYSDQISDSVTNNIRVNSYETDEYGIGVQFHEVLGKVGFYTDYRVRNRTTKGPNRNLGINDTDKGINFGVTGQILPRKLFPKLEADLSFGFDSNKQLEGRQRDGDRLSIHGSLSYPATTKINVSLVMDRSLAITTIDNTAEVSQLTLSSQYLVSSKIVLSSSIGRIKNDYIDSVIPRNDKITQIVGTAQYRLNNRVTLLGSLQYRDSESELSFRTYDRLLASFRTTLTF